PPPQSRARSIRARRSCQPRRRLERSPWSACGTFTKTGGEENHAHFHPAVVGSFFGCSFSAGVPICAVSRPFPRLLVLPLLPALEVAAVEVAAALRGLAAQLHVPL